MIPTIEQIVEDVKSGAITVSQAIAWLYEHANGSANDLRHHFAGLAMSQMLSTLRRSNNQEGRAEVAHWAYEMADEMIKTGAA